MRNLIKDELINYIRSIYGSDDNLHTMLYEYKNQGKEAFFEDLDKAAACIENISDYRMENVFENLRDAVPMFRGVILGQKTVSRTDNIILDDIYDSLGTQDEFPEFVYEWGVNTLENPHYADLLSRFVRYSPGMVSEEGSLVNFAFTVETTKSFCITSELNIMSVRTNMIYFTFDDGDRFYLYRENQFKTLDSPFDSAEEMLDAIIGMDSVLRRAM